MTTPWAPAEVSFLILTYSPSVSSAVAKNVTRSPVRGFSMVRGSSSVMGASSLLLLTPVYRSSMTPTIVAYSPECVEGLFCELRLYGVLGSSPLQITHLGDTRGNKPRYVVFVTTRTVEVLRVELGRA